MCLMYEPTMVACVCINLACKFSSFKIEPCSKQKDWFYYIDPNLTLEKLNDLTQKFLHILIATPHRYKGKAQKNLNVLNHFKVVDPPCTVRKGANKENIPEKPPVQPSLPGSVCSSQASVKPLSAGQSQVMHQEPTSCGQSTVVPLSSKPDKLVETVIQPSVPSEALDENKESLNKMSPVSQIAPVVPDQIFKYPELPPWLLNKKLLKSAVHAKPLEHSTFLKKIDHPVVELNSNSAVVNSASGVSSDEIFQMLQEALKNKFGEKIPLTAYQVLLKKIEIALKQGSQSSHNDEPSIKQKGYEKILQCLILKLSEISSKTKTTIQMGENSQNSQKVTDLHHPEEGVEVSNNLKLDEPDKIPVKQQTEMPDHQPSFSVQDVSLPIKENSVVNLEFQPGSSVESLSEPLPACLEEKESNKSSQMTDEHSSEKVISSPVFECCQPDSSLSFEKRTDVTKETFSSMWTWLSGLLPLVPVSPLPSDPTVTNCAVYSDACFSTKNEKGDHDSTLTTTLSSKINGNNKYHKQDCISPSEKNLHMTEETVSEMKSWLSGLHILVPLSPLPSDPTILSVPCIKKPVETVTDCATTSKACISLKKEKVKRDSRIADTSLSKKAKVSTNLKYPKSLTVDKPAKNPDCLSRVKPDTQSRNRFKNAPPVGFIVTIPLELVSLKGTLSKIPASKNQESHKVRKSTMNNVKEQRVGKVKKNLNHSSKLKQNKCIRNAPPEGIIVRIRRELLKGTFSNSGQKHQKHSKTDTSNRGIKRKNSKTELAVKDSKHSHDILPSKRRKLINVL